ncbi:hypothetical protein KC338_g83 [Hortaea werneckii]|nr:hypothetical protein KC338_g83 [Hortaea werneckii]
MQLSVSQSDDCWPGTQPDVSLEERSVSSSFSCPGELGLCHPVNPVPFVPPSRCLRHLRTRPFGSMVERPPPTP